MEEGEIVRQKFDLVEVHPSLLSDIDRVDLIDEEYETLVQMGMQAREVKNYAQWILGKLAYTLLEHHHGDLTKYATAVGEVYEVLRRYGATYKAFIEEDPNFHPSKYAGMIPWGVFEVAATWDRKNPQKVVTAWHDDNVRTVKGAIADIQRKKGGIRIPPAPKFGFIWNEEKHQHTITIDLNDLSKIDWPDYLIDDLKAYWDSIGK